MAKSSFSPRFLRAMVRFQLRDNWYEAGEQFVNPNGVNGFSWNAFKPMNEVGQAVTVEISLILNEPNPNEQSIFVCVGWLTCEQTAAQTQLGLLLQLSPDQTATIWQFIGKEGILPEYVRKFPRLVFDRRVQSMPQHAVIRWMAGASHILSVTEIENLSPSGLQVCTEDTRSAVLQPTETISMELMPRSGTQVSISLFGEVKRITRGYSIDSGNLKWSFGLSIVSMDEADRKQFSALLRTVVLQLQNTI